jgi:flagellar biosynthesis protein FliQ
MLTDYVITLARNTLETALWLSAPVLIVAIAVGLTMSMIQVMTSIQEVSISTVPRLLAVGVTALLTMPWFLKKLSYFTVQLFTDFHPYLR